MPRRRLLSTLGPARADSCGPSVAARQTPVRFGEGWGRFMLFMAATISSQHAVFTCTEGGRVEGLWLPRIFIRVLRFCKEIPRQHKVSLKHNHRATWDTPRQEAGPVKGP